MTAADRLLRHDPPESIAWGRFLHRNGHSIWKNWHGHGCAAVDRDELFFRQYAGVFCGPAAARSVGAHCRHSRFLMRLRIAGPKGRLP